MRILLVGGTGFIGTAIREAVRRAYTMAAGLAVSFTSRSRRNPFSPLPLNSVEGFPP